MKPQRISITTKPFTTRWSVVVIVIVNVIVIVFVIVVIVVIIVIVAKNNRPNVTKIKLEKWKIRLTSKSLHGSLTDFSLAEIYFKPPKTGSCSYCLLPVVCSHTINLCLKREVKGSRDTNYSYFDSNGIFAFSSVDKNRSLNPKLQHYIHGLNVV